MCHYDIQHQTNEEAFLKSYINFVHIIFVCLRTGIQGQSWAETIRTFDNWEYMVFPRLLALAERAWHKAPWESITDVNNRKTELDKDWEAFANTLGYKELGRLDRMGVKYRVPLVGAKQVYLNVL